MRKARDLTELAQEIDRNLGEIRRAMRKPVAARIVGGELTVPQRHVMEILVRSDGVSLKELSRQAALAHSTVSGIVDRLEKRGMATRQADEKDGRFSRIVVAEEIRDFVRDKLPGLAMPPLLEALRHASPAQRTKIATGLRTLRLLLGVG